MVIQLIRRPIRIYSLLSRRSFTSSSSSSCSPPREPESTTTSSTTTTLPSPPPVPVRVQVKSKADWKRRQESSQSFIDSLSILVESGRGGSGGVSFHREKFKQKGPPSGGPGGSGGSVFIIATPTVSNLNHLPNKVKGENGKDGGGKWLAGSKGKDVILRVPIGTVVRELVKPQDNLEEEEEFDEIDKQERKQLEWAYQVNKVRLLEAEARDSRWTKWKKLKDHQDKFGSKDKDHVEVIIEPFIELEEQEFEPEKLQALKDFRKKCFKMYPQAELTGHPSFLTTEHHLLSELLSRPVIELPGGTIMKRSRRHHHQRRRRQEEGEVEPLLELDLDKPTPLSEPILLVKGGNPGLGNPSFLTHRDRSPKYALKGGSGETMRLQLELKSLGEVGLVGLPNSGKSTLLSSLTNSNPKIASYGFTTLNPILATCVVYTDQTFSGPLTTTTTLGDTPLLSTHFSGNSITTNTTTHPHPKKKEELLRFTITDNPGLLPNSHLNHGLGHSFLRHIERCKSLIYVIDLSSPDHGGVVETLQILENSLKEYEIYKGLKKGELVNRVKGVVANKADLFTTNENTTTQEEEEGVESSSSSSIEQGQKRLKELKDFVVDRTRTSTEEDNSMWVIPISAKNRQNVSTLVKQLSKDVLKEREREEKKKQLKEEQPYSEDEDYERWVR